MINLRKTDGPFWADQTYHVEFSSGKGFVMSLVLLDQISQHLYVGINEVKGLSLGDIREMKKDLSKMLGRWKLECRVKKGESRAIKFAKFLGFEKVAEDQSFIYFIRGEV